MAGSAPNDPLLDSSAGIYSVPTAANEADTAAAAYDRFDLAEAVIVLSNYDLGVISAVQEFRKGSRRAPKLLVKCDRGLLVLKRLAPGRDDASRIAFAHEVQRILIEADFPLPRLIATRTGTTLLHSGRHAYELFESMSGQPYDQSPEATFDAGALLARFHAVLLATRPASPAPTGSYHRLAAVPANLAFIPHRLADDSLVPLVESLKETYLWAAAQADSLGFASWPLQIIHGDWHPGNLLFRAQKVAAVIDYDTARLQPRIVDIANGVLQFSLTRTPDNPDTWPDAPDEPRMKRFCQGYDSVASPIISTSELASLPTLMIEAMIAESATPIAVTGRFGRLDPAPILRMVERKVRWLRANQERIVRLLS